MYEAVVLLGYLVLCVTLKLRLYSCDKFFLGLNTCNFFFFPCSWCHASHSIASRDAHALPYCAALLRTMQMTDATPCSSTEKVVGTRGWKAGGFIYQFFHKCGANL